MSPVKSQGPSTQEGEAEEVRVMVYEKDLTCLASLEVRGKGPQAKHGGSLRNLERVRNGFSSRSSRKEHSPDATLIIIQ